MKKAVIFDVDGTLLNTERIYMHAWRLVGKEHGFDVTDQVLRDTRAISRAQAAGVFKAALGEDFDYESYFPRRIEIAEELIAKSDDLLMPGVLDTLRYLRSHKIPTAVASSTDREKTVSHLDHAKLSPYIDAFVGGDMVEKGKPNPDIFLKAASLLGVAPEDCIVIEDTTAGIRAAAAAGMTPVLIPDTAPATELAIGLSHTVLESMEQLPALLDTLLT